MSLRPRAATATPVIVALGAVLLLAGCGDATTSAPGSIFPGDVPRASDRVIPTPDATALADAAAMGRWRPAPIVPSPAFASAVESACRATAAVGRLPLAVLDARGQGLATLVFADATAAVVCRAAVDQGHAATADARPVVGFSGGEPPAPSTLGLHDLEAITGDAVPRTVVVGQVGEGVSKVSVNFDDATWSQATMDNGWFATWWPSVAEALGIAAVDTHNVVIDSYPP